MRNNLSYTIKRLEIETKATIFNITDKFQSLVFHDSIFSPTMTGSVVIKDSIGFSEKFKSDGTETLIVHLEKMDCSQTFKKLFTLYTNRGGNRSVDNTQQSVLTFASPEYLLSMKRKVFSTYKKTYSDIVNSILLKELEVKENELKITNSLGMHDVVFSNKSPFSCIMECTKKAIDEYDSATFLFFENKYGFHFTSLAKIAKKSPNFVYDYNPKNFSGLTGDSLLSITKMNVVKQYDIRDEIKSGMHGVNTVSYDILQHSVKITPMNIQDMTKGVNLNPGSISMNKSALDKDSINYPMMCYPVGPNAFSGGASKLISPFDLNKSDDSDKYYSQRKTQMMRYFLTRVRIVVPGNFDLVSGSVIELKIPFGGIKTTDDNLDTHLSGKYIIIGVKHKLNIQGHETILEISKDSTLDQTIYNLKEDSYESEKHITNVNEQEDD